MHRSIVRQHEEPNDTYELQPYHKVYFALPSAQGQRPTTRLQVFNQSDIPNRDLTSIITKVHILLCGVLDHVMEEHGTCSQREHLIPHPNVLHDALVPLGFDSSGVSSLHSLRNFSHKLFREILHVQRVGESRYGFGRTRETRNDDVPN